MRKLRVSAAKWPMSSALYQAPQFPIPFVRSVSESHESATLVGLKRNKKKPAWHNNSTTRAHARPEKKEIDTLGPLAWSVDTENQVALTETPSHKICSNLVYGSPCRTCS